MNAVVGPILSYILLYKYPVLFVVNFLSALIIPFPANTTLAAVGAFTSEGYMKIGPAFFFALAGNIAGDLGGYLIARVLRHRVSGWVRAEHWSRYLNRLDQSIRHYAGITIFITRFTPAIEILTNFLAGLAVVPFWQFLLWDTFGNGINTAAYMAAGYFIGADWQNIAGIFGITGAILVVLVLIAAAITIYRAVLKENFEKK